MAQLYATGTATYPRVFAELTCPVDRMLTRHAQLRVLAQWLGHRNGEWQILVECATCRLRHVWQTDILPAGLQPFHVRLHAHGGVVPGLGSVVPELTEEFTVLALDRQGAYRQAIFASTMPLAGQFVETFVDGEEERDARF